MNSKIRKLAIPGVLAVGIGGGLTLADVARDPIADAVARQTAPAANAASPQALSTAFRSASANALPGVVHVQVRMAGRTVSNAVPPEFRGTPFEDMFGGRGSQAPRASSGSGFIVSPDGYVVTNNHVVDGATDIRVVLDDKREFDARVVGRDPNTDIAVLKIDGRNLPTVKLGDSDALETGDWVLALGYPLSLGQTTTAGIVSAKGRSIGIMERTAGSASPVEHFIQTDAAINPGNSGGPLVDLQGRVVGVNSAIASQTGYYQGYGFAVPINLAKRVADDLIADGVVHRPLLGVEIREATPADAEVFRLPSADGAVVSSDPKGAAAEAGLRLGDVIVAIDGRRVTDTGSLMETVMRKRPGDRVAVDYIRYGDRRQATVRLTEAQNARPALTSAPAGAVDAGTAESRVGFRAVPVTPQIARELELSEARGVVVSAVDPVGPAAGQLFRGLLIERLNGREIRGEAELRAAVAAVKPNQVVSIIGRRPDGSQVIANFRAGD